MADIKCLVVDDEPLAARLIGYYVERTPFHSLFHLSDISYYL